METDSSADMGDGDRLEVDCVLKSYQSVVLVLLGWGVDCLEDDAWKVDSYLAFLDTDNRLLEVASA